MAEVLNWRTDEPTLVARAAQALTTGQVVVFPTDTVYVAAGAARLPEVVQRLAEGNVPLTLALLAGPPYLEQLVAGLDPGLRRVLRKCWPGPVAVALPVEQAAPLLECVPPTVRPLLVRNGRVQVQTPAHMAILEVLRQVDGPVVLRPLGPSGTAVIDAEQAQSCTEPAWDLLLADGTTTFGGATTVLSAEPGGWSILTQGVAPPGDLLRCAALQVLFVCTGNTCRSPLAEGLCKRLLAESLACPVEELPTRGFLVLSAGLAAMMGGEATPEAIEIARELGVDLSGHRSQPLTAELLAQADQVYAMTSGHLFALSRYAQILGFSADLLAPDNEDVTDPIGGESEVYRECAQQILQHLQQRLPALIPAPQ